MEEDCFFAWLSSRCLDVLLDVTPRDASSFLNRQKFQVPKMEGFLYLSLGYLGGGGSRPYIRTAYRVFRTSILGTWKFFGFPLANHFK